MTSFFNKWEVGAREGDAGVNGAGAVCRLRSPSLEVELSPGGVERVDHDSVAAGKNVTFVVSRQFGNTMNLDGICHFLCSIAVRDGGAHQTQPPVEPTKGMPVEEEGRRPLTDHPCPAAAASRPRERETHNGTHSHSKLRSTKPFSNMGRMTSSHSIPLWRLKGDEPIAWPC